MERAEAERLFLAAAQEAAGAFPVDEPRLSLVTVSENVTFRLTDGRTGEDWVLRLHRPGYNSAAELEAERVWTAALREAGLEAPEPLPARDGRAFVPQRVEGAGETRLVGVTRWIEGEILEGLLKDPAWAGERPRWFARLGALVAYSVIRSGAPGCGRSACTSRHETVTSGTCIERCTQRSSTARRVGAVIAIERAAKSCSAAAHMLPAPRIVSRNASVSGTPGRGRNDHSLGPSPGPRQKDSNCRRSIPGVESSATKPGTSGRSAGDAACGRTDDPPSQEAKGM